MIINPRTLFPRRNYYKTPSPSPFRLSNPIIKIITNRIYDLPVAPNLSIWWNFGSMLGLCLIIQIITGIFLAIHYTPHIDYAFSSVAHIARDVNKGWIIRNIHANGASIFFICLYCHIGRGIYYGSYLLKHVWWVGSTLFVLTIATAFFGYVLPWGQISFWGATVITNLFSAIPYLGQSLVEWIWGGYAVANPTLNRFFVFHFLLPFVLIILSILHLLFLHQTGSSDPLGIDSRFYLIPIHPYYITKDIVGFIVFIAVLLYLAFLNPLLLGDPENFIPANPLATPLHIQPEWYFLFVYAILRTIPNKLGGVLALTAAIIILYILPIFNNSPIKGNTFNLLGQILFWTITTNFILLTWAGARPIEPPFDYLRIYFTILYFILFALIPLSSSSNNYIIIIR